MSAGFLGMLLCALCAQENDNRTVISQVEEAAKKSLLPAGKKAQAVAAAKMIDGGRLPALMSAPVLVSALFDIDDGAILRRSLLKFSREDGVCKAVRKNLQRQDGDDKFSISVASLNITERDIALRASQKWSNGDDLSQPESMVLRKLGITRKKE